MYPGTVNWIIYYDETKEVRANSEVTLKQKEISGGVYHSVLTKGKKEDSSWRYRIVSKVMFQSRAVSDVESG